jgi:hypothetical protein
VFAGEAVAYPDETPLGAPFKGRLLVLPVSSRMDWRGLPRTKSLVSFENSKFMLVKVFITWGPEDVIRCFFHSLLILVISLSVCV